MSKDPNDDPTWHGLRFHDPANIPKDDGGTPIPRSILIVVVVVNGILAAITLLIMALSGNW